MRFRILDLFLATTFIAGIFGAYANDLILFRQALFLACTTVFATLGCLGIAKNRSPAASGAFGGAIGGVVFTLVTLLSPFPFYFSATQYHINSWHRVATDSAPFIELSLAPFLAMILGAAIGPLFVAYLKGNTSAANQKQQMLSWCFFGAACLLMLFSMMDRLKLGSSRNWMLAVPVLLVIFVVHTIQWVQKEHRISVADDGTQSVEQDSQAEA